VQVHNLRKAIPHAYVILLRHILWINMPFVR
jgi:hypothetical protein